MSGDPGEIAYNEALFLMNDMCGGQVGVRVCAPDGAVLSARGPLKVDRAEPDACGCYRVGEACLDLSRFGEVPAFRATTAAGGVLSFHAEALRVDVWPVPDGML